MDPTHLPQPLTLSADEIAAIPMEPMPGLDGVTHRVVWRDGSATAGVMRIEAGHNLGTHAHRVNQHHLWVLDGRAHVLGKQLGPGSYIHVPAGVDHDVDASATEGCTFLYLYLALAR